MPSGKISGYSQIAGTSIVPSVDFLVLDPNDTSTSPAGAGGSDKRMTIGQLLPGVVWPSGDTSGVKDAAAINAAVAAFPTATGGVVTLVPTGTWYINCNSVIINRSGIYINAAGCYILAVGSGDVFRMYDSSNLFSRTVWGGGLIGMPTIDGTNTTGNSSAFHAGDITQLCAYAQAQNFHAGSTSKGFWFDSQWWWTEQLYGHVVAQNCRTHVQYDNSTGNTNPNATGSYDTC